MMYTYNIDFSYLTNAVVRTTDIYPEEKFLQKKYVELIFAYVL